MFRLNVAAVCNHGSGDPGNTPVMEALAALYVPPLSGGPINRLEGGAKAFPVLGQMVQMDRPPLEVSVFQPVEPDPRLVIVPLELMLIKLELLLMMVPEVLPSLKMIINPLTAWLRLVGLDKLLVSVTVTVPPAPIVITAEALTG